MRKTVSVSEMTTMQLYRCPHDNKLYRRLKPELLEVLANGKWQEVKITSQLLQELKLYPLGKPSNKLFQAAKQK